MAHRQAFQNYLQSIGFPADLRAALVIQGLDNVTNFLGMTDDDVDDLCANIRKPGGVAPNPANAEDEEAPPQFIADPGIAVGRIYQERLKQIAYYYSYLVVVNRTFIANNATVEELVRLWKYKKNLESILKGKKDGDDDYPDKFTNARPAREVIESMENWITEHYGIENIPLSYVIRDNPEVPRVADDPPLGRPSYTEELIRRASHAGEAWVANNGKVWQMIRHVTHGTDAWAFVKAYSRTQDGRGAFLALKAQYMGTDFVNKVKLNADASLDSLHWTGKTKNFTWDKFISRLTSAFADLADHGEPKTESEKVRRLLRAITDPNLTVAKAVVQGNPEYAGNFMAATAYLAGQLSAAESMQAGRRNISEVNTGRERAGRDGGRGQGRGGRFGRGARFQGNRGGGRGRTGGRGRGGRGGGRYSRSGHLLSNGGYPYAVWSTFTEEEKSQVYRMRDQQAEQRQTAALSTNSTITTPTTTPETNRQRDDASNEPRGIGALMTRRSS